MKVWSVVNQKGGVGKTTSAVSMAGCLSALGYRTLLIDLDPQASLSHYLGVDSDKLEVTMYDVFMASHNSTQAKRVVNQAIVANVLPHTDIIPAHMALATLDRSLGESKGKGLIVKKALKSLSKPYDYVVIDCQPVLGVLMVNALVAANSLVIPTQTEHLAFLGLQKMLKTIELMRQSMAPDCICKIVPTLFDRRVKACLNAYAALREQHQAMLWRGYIPVDTKFRDASVQGLPITQVAPSSRGAFAYEKLVNELIKHGG